MNKLRQEADQLLRRGQFRHAIPMLKKIFKAEPNDAQIARALGFASFQVSQFLEAADYFQSAMKISNRRDSATLCDLARSRMMTGQHELAIVAFEEAEAIAPLDLDAIASLAKLYENAARYADLESLFRRSVKSYPGNAKLAVALAEELIDGGKIEEAQQTFGGTPLVFNDPRFGIRAALVLQQLGNHHDALNLLQESATHGSAPALVHGLFRQSLKAVHGERLLDALNSNTQKQHPALRYQLALELCELGRYGESNEVVLGAGPPVPENLTSELQAHIALGLGKVSEANAKFDKVWTRAAAAFKKHDQRPQRIPAPGTRAVAPLIYMPVEIGERELNSRIYTALFAAQRGLSSVIAPTHTMSTVAGGLPPGIFLHKTLNSIDRVKVVESAAGGHLFTAIDEEAIAWTGGNEVMLCGVDAMAVSLMDTIFVTGERHARAYREEFPESDAKLCITGNPRIDFLSEELKPQFSERTQEIRAKYGAFVLICTSFASIHSANFNFEGLCDVFFRVTAPTAANKDFDGILALGRASVYAEGAYLEALARHLSEVALACPEKNFVLRVHPAEHPSYWWKFARDYPNVHVETGGALQPWLFAAESMIYMAGCSTGLEAFLAGVPALKLLVDPSLTVPRIGLSYILNQTVTSAAEIVAGIRELPRSPVDRMQQDALVAEHIRLGGGLAAARIADGLRDLYAAHASGASADSAAVRNVLDKLLAEGARRSRRKFRGDRGMPLKRAVVDSSAAAAMARTAGAAFGLAVAVNVVRLGEDSILISPL